MAFPIEKRPVGACASWNLLMAGGAGVDESTPSRRAAACPVENGGVHIRIRPRLVETDSATNNRPAESKAMPAGVVKAVSEVAGLIPGLYPLLAKSVCP